MDTASWDGNVDSSLDAKYLLDLFLTCCFDHNKPPSYTDLVRKEKTFRKYKYESMRKAIPKIAFQAGVILARKEKSNCFNSTENLQNISIQKDSVITVKQELLMLPYEVWAWS